MHPGMAEERIDIAMADADFVRKAVLHATSDKKFVTTFLIDEEEWEWKEGNDIEAFAYLSPALKSDPMVIASAMRENIRAMEWVPEDALSAMLTTLVECDINSKGGVPRPPLALAPYARNQSFRNAASGR